MKRWLDQRGWWSGTGSGVRTSGYPTSSNRASSCHLRWGGLPTVVELVAAEVVLEVIEPPQVAELYFWALQVSFADRRRRTGGGHLGLQWHPDHPGSTAMNWGGYADGGGELQGSTSPFPSATGNANTRDYRWEGGRRHRLAVTRGREAGLWTGWVDHHPVRDLAGGGRSLTDLMVWSEAFAQCDDPGVAVRWSSLRAEDRDGEWHRPDRVTVTYQSHAHGGCDNSTVSATDAGLVQHTNAERTIAHGTVLPI